MLFNQHAPPPCKSACAAFPAQGDAVVDDMMGVLERMGARPGRDCQVGGGLAVADVGLFLDGIKVRTAACTA